MRVIKENTAKFESFHKFLPELEKANRQNGNLRIVKNNFDAGFDSSDNSESSLIARLEWFGRFIKSAESTAGVVREFINNIKNINGIKEIAVFKFNDNSTKLVPEGENTNAYTTRFVNTAYKEGLLEKTLDSGKFRVIPDFKFYNNSSKKMSFILVPVKNGISIKGIISLFVPQLLIDENNTEYIFLTLLLEKLQTHYELMKNKEEIKNAYNEMHIYQSKLSNDYKLSAIGEFTTGITEDIVSPLQVILSYTDLLAREYDEIDGEIIDTIKSQISRIRLVISRLVKFADVSDEKYKIEPCDINPVIEDYYNVIITSVKMNNYECILDLDENIPSILSNKNYLHQILTNIFSLLMEKKNSTGGILIQTRYYSGSVNLRVITSDFIESFKSNNSANSKEMSLRIIGNLVKKHEGKIKLETSETTGSSISISFPVKRNIR